MQDNYPFATFLDKGIPPEGTQLPSFRGGNFQREFQERPTFDNLLGGKGISIPESHRKWLELNKDYRLQALVNPPQEESSDLKLLKALRRTQDLKATAMKTGQDVGEVSLRQAPPRNTTNMTANVTDSDDFEQSINNSRVAQLMKMKDQELASEAKNRRRRQEFGKKLNYPHTLAEKRFVQFGGDLGSMGGGVMGAGAGVFLVGNINALQDPATLAALNTIFGAGGRYYGHQVGTKVAEDIVKASRVVKEKVTPEYFDGFGQDNPFGPGTPSDPLLEL